MRQSWMIVAGIGLGILALGSAEAMAQSPHLHRHNWLAGTYLDPAIQRPDIFPRVIINNVPGHREVYNRPRYLTGKFLYHFEPTSQEAMAWETNVCNGNYRNHRGAYVPMYYYPKPWEALNTRARPDFAKPVGLQGVPSVMEAVDPALP
ncbi:MAG: hypothetical protein MUF23_00950 [Pirellula sp.]|jgi:hypothetical protein|nr:hypothetical protein [Pirellula sp.]